MLWLAYTFYFFGSFFCKKKRFTGFAQAIVIKLGSTKSQTTYPFRETNDALWSADTELGFYFSAARPLPSS